MFNCTVCDTSISTGGYSFGGNLSVEEVAYYCSKECLHKHFTPEEWKAVVNSGLGDSMDNG